MQNEVFAHVENLPIKFFDSLPAGKVVSRITSDTRDVRILYRVVLSQLSIAFLFTLGILITLLLIDYRMFLLQMVFVPLLLVVYKDFKGKSKKYNYRFRRHISELNAAINEDISSIEVISAFNKEEDIYGEFEEVNKKIYHEGLNITKLFSYSAFNAVDTILLLTKIAALLYFGYGFVTGAWKSSVGLLYVFMDYSTRLYDWILEVVLRVGNFEKAGVAADHIFELLEMEKVKYEDEEIEKIEGQVEFQDVTFAYKEGEDVLKNINFKQKEGTSVAFVGHTGSGKSTIMNLLFGFYKPSQGRVKIDGKDIYTINVKELRREMSIVLQDPYIFTGSLKDNVTLFDNTYKDEEVKEALEKVGAKRLIERTPEGIYTEIREKGSGYSQGEKQLISFARALIVNPKILVLDEATSSIDTETESYIQKGIDALKEGRTTLIIAHRLSTIKNVDKIYVLDKGRIIEEGSHSELIELGGVYKNVRCPRKTRNI